MKIGLAAATSGELAVLRAAAGAANVDVAWAARTAADLEASAASVSLVVIAHGDTLDATTAARELAARGAVVVLVVDDPARRVDALYRATEGGGVEVARMPVLDADGTLRGAAELVGIIARRARPERRTGAPAASSKAPVLVIAASAGGPDALAAVLSSLARDLPLRVIVAQHIEPTFTTGLASWLASCTARAVEVADEGRALCVDHVLVVRSDRQPIVDALGVVRYRPLDPTNPFHPCIDTLLTSLAAARSLHGAAALLTGMGSDGALGLLALREAGWVTIAQDAESSRVFGMPRAAARLGAAKHVVPLDRIGLIASRALRAEKGAAP